MTESSILVLVQNAALLIALAFIFDITASRWGLAERQLRRIPTGLLLGAIGITIMLTPWVLRPGLVFDTRSVMLSIAGLFFGTVPTAIAVMMTAAFRIWQGGVGAIVGLTVIVTSATIGIVWRHARKRRLQSLTWQELLLFGLAVHAAMLAAMFALPWDLAIQTITTIGIPVMVIYPIGTMFLGLLFVRRLQRTREEEGIRKRQIALARSQEIASVGYWAMGRAPASLVWSDQMYKIFGIGPTLTGRQLVVAWAKMIDPESRRSIGETIRGVRDAHGRTSVEFSFQRPDGEERDIIAVMDPPERDHRGRFLEVTGIVQDVTERKQSERREVRLRIESERLLAESNASRRALLSIMEDQREAERRLAENEERLRLALQSARQGLYDLNVQTGDTIVSAEYAAMLGYDPATFKETNAAWLDRLHPDDRQRTEEMFRRYIEGKEKEYRVEFRQWMKSGEWKWILSVGRVTERDPDGKPLRMLGTHTDISVQKALQSALREQEATLRLFIEHAPAALAMFDEEMGYLAVSRRWLTDYGIPSDIIGRSHYDVFPEISDRWKEIHQQGMRGEVIRAEQDMFLRADGTQQWLRWEVRPWHTLEGDVGGIVIFSEDITDKKVSEKKLERLGRILDGSSNEIYIFDAKTLHFVQANKGALHNLGYTLEELGRLTPMDLKPDYDLTTFEALIAPLRSGERDMVMFETMHKRKNGSLYPIDVRVHLSRSEDPPVFVAIIQDVTERRKAQEALRASQERFKLLFDNSTFGVVICQLIRDASGNAFDFQYLQVNKALHRHVGILPEDVLGKRGSEIMSEEEMTFLVDKVRSVVETKEPFEFQQKLPSFNRTIDMQAIHVDGDLFSVIFFDITERERAEEALRVYSSQLKQMAARLQDIRERERKDLAREMHDEIGQQLTAIRMDIALIERSLSGTVPLTDCAGVIAQLDGLRSLVDRSISSVRAMTSRLRPDVLDKLGFGDALQWLSDDFEKRNDIRCELSVVGSVSILQDPIATTLFRAVQEGLTNIAKHAHASNVSVSLRGEADRWLCEIVDDGVGFEPDTAGSKDSFGLIGMRERIEALGGRLTIESAQAKGTRLLVSLPIGLKRKR